MTQQPKKKEMKVNKKYQYHFNLCPYCERPIISREPTKIERERFHKKYEGVSISKFDQQELLVIKDCGCPYYSKYALGFRISIKKAEKYLNL